MGRTPALPIAFHCGNFHEINEILVSEEEINHTIKRNSYYAICSMLPEVSNGTGTHANALTKEFSSADTLLDRVRSNF